MHCMNRSYSKVFQVSLASEAKHRTLAHGAAGDNLVAEMVHFTFSRADGGDNIREAPFVFVSNLIARVADTLTHHLE